MIDLSQWYGLPSVPIAIALVQAVKLTFDWPSASWPWVSMLIAVTWNVAVGYLLGERILTSAVAGVVYGLMASGLYSAVKAHVEQIRTSR